MAEQPIHVILVESPIARHLRSDHLSSAPPRQIVGVVLHHCRKNYAIPAQRVTERELVYRLSSVLPEDDRVGVHVDADEAPYYIVRLVISGSADSRLESCASMHARIVGQELQDRFEHIPEWRRAGGVIEVDIGNQPAIQERQLAVNPDNSLPPSVRAVQM